MRPRRALKPGAKYHVSARINRDECILKDKAIKNLFLSIVKEARKKYAFTMDNFCIIDEKVGMILHPGFDASLSRIMQWILSVFAIRYNRKKKIHGHVWYDRFKSRIVDSMADLHAAFFALAFMPVEAGLTREPGVHPFCGLQRIAQNDYSLLSKPPDQLLPLLRRLLNGLPEGP